jgi:hypothetical protein
LQLLRRNYYVTVFKKITYRYAQTFHLQRQQLTVYELGVDLSVTRFSEFFQTKVSRFLKVVNQSIDIN